MEQLTHEEFLALSPEEMQGRTGIEAPENPSEEELEDYKQKAWESYKVDIATRDQWGTADEDNPLPRGDEPEV